MAEQDDDVALIRRWFQKLQLCIQAVDFVGSRPLFADDIVTMLFSNASWSSSSGSAVAILQISACRRIPHETSCPLVFQGDTDGNYRGSRGVTLIIRFRPLDG